MEPTTTQQFPTEGDYYGRFFTVTQPYLNKNDVICGRGGSTNRNPGNKAFRDLVSEYKNEYIGARKKEKPIICDKIIVDVLPLPCF